MKELFFNYKIVRIIVISLLMIISLSLVIVLFFKFYPPFGGTPSYKDKEDYEKRSTNYKNGKFQNENEFKLMYNTDEENKYISNKDSKPKDKIPVKKPMIIDKPEKQELNITWLGHSTILININGMNI